MLKWYACTLAELSCIIGNLFAELSPPCDHCGEEGLTLTGTTVTGNAGTLYILPDRFCFEGCAADAATVDRMRKGRCINAEAGTGTERAFGIQRNCKVQGSNKAHVHDYEQYGALPKEIPLHACKPDTG